MPRSSARFYLISLGILAEVKVQLRAANGGNECFRQREYIDYIGTTAAPSFYPPEHVVFADGSEHRFQDGGLLPTKVRAEDSFARFGE